MHCNYYKSYFHKKNLLSENEKSEDRAKKVTIHILRHTAITHLVQGGIDLPTVQRVSGHKTLSMVVRYSHQNSDHIQSAMSVKKAN
jgi:site-specific recombinase XerD